MKASVVVPTFNRRQVLRRTLAMLLSQTLPAEEYEIIVVDDGSTDGTAEWIEKCHEGSRLRVIRQVNRGLAAARNTGLRAAGGDMVVFVDDDMLCDPSTVSAHITACEAEPEVVSIGAIFLSEDSPRTLASDCFEKEIGAFPLHYAESPIPLPDDYWVFSNTAARRSELLEIDGFDECLRMREDAELGLRLRAAGWKFRYSPAAIAYQIYLKSARDLLQDAAAFSVADRLVMEKHPAWKLGSGFEWPSTKPAWRRWTRRIAAQVPVLPDAILSGCWLGASRFRRFRPVQHLGSRALQLHRHLIWYRGMRVAGKSAAVPHRRFGLPSSKKAGNTV